MDHMQLIWSLFTSVIDQLIMPALDNNSSSSHRSVLTEIQRQYQREYRKSETNPEYHHTFGVLFLGMGNFPAARASFQRAVTNSHNDHNLLKYYNYLILAYTGSIMYPHLEIQADSAPAAFDPQKFEEHNRRQEAKVRQLKKRLENDINRFASTHLYHSDLEGAICMARGIAHTKLKECQEAEEHLKKAKQLDFAKDLIDKWMDKAKRPCPDIRY